MACSQTPPAGPCGPLGAGQLVVVLGEVACVDLVPPLRLPGVGLDLAHGDLAQGRLAAPVGAAQAEAVAGADFQSEPGKYRVSVELTSQISGGKQNHESGQRRWPMVLHWPTMANGCEGALRPFGLAVQIQEMAKR